MERCFQNGITRLFLPNVDVDSIEKVFETVEAYPNHCFPMLGLHPCDVKENYQDQLDQIYSKIQQSTIYAIGEIGIDLYWDKSTLAIQQDAFAQQINWAKDLGLPISIHCREAFDEVFEVLDAHADERLFGIFHCFTGTLEQAHRAIKLGFKLGIGGILTYKKSGLDAVVKENESSYLIHIAQKLADIHETGIDKVAEITTNNSKNVFKI
jgi:TatD DNase family protein